MSSITDQIIERLKELRDQVRYYGLIMGGIFIGIELISYYIQYHPSIVGGFLLFIIKVSLLFISSRIIVKRIKPEFFKLGMSYMQSFSLIFRLFLYGALLVGIYTFVLSQWINPDYHAEVRELTTSHFQSYFENADIPEAQSEAIIEALEERFETIEEIPLPTPLQAMWGQIWAYMFWGIFVG